ncbi:MAG: DUF4097 family beta strand repeat-containing protein [Bacteriovorax sp.]
MKKVFLALALSSLGVFGGAQAFEVKEVDSTGVKKLTISNPKGEIFLSSAKSAKKITVSLDKIEFDKKCKLTINSTMGTLKVAIEHENALFDKSNCISKLKIEVPARIFDTEISSGTANVKVVDVEGKIDFKTATGAVDISGETLKNIEGKTATGNMRLSFKKCPARADIDFVTATGDGEIFLPTDCKIRVNHKSATGDLFNELGESEDYQVLIESKSAGGSLKIKKLAK